MFLDDFESGTEERPKRQKKAKKEYAAGFKNYHPQKCTLSTDSPPPSQDDLFFSQLKIGNLKELYLQSLPQEHSRHEQSSKEKESIARLYEKFEKPKQKQENEEDENQRRAEMEQKFRNTYHKVDNYEEKANKVLFLGEFGKMKEKILQTVNKKGKGWNSTEVFVTFLMKKIQLYKTKEKITNDEILFDFGNYLNLLVFGGQQTITESVKLSDLKDVVIKNLFLFGFFNLQVCEDRILTVEKVRKAIRKEEGQDFDWNVVDQLLDKKITVPYQSQLYKSYSNKERKKLSPTKDEKEQSRSIKNFHANPVPKTTYEKPQQRPKSQMHKTQSQPFNLTAVVSTMPKMEDFYNWDRTFHPQQIPETTYKPQTIHHLTEDQKKIRALQLLQSSNYPSTMKYLNNLNQISEQKKEDLLKKYTKERKIEAVKPVPNFQAIHKRQLQSSQQCKIEKRQLTKPEPFNLSQPRKPKQLVYQISNFRQEIEQPQKKKRRFDSQPRIQPSSTLKYDAYVDHLKKQKEKKIEKEYNKKKEEGKRSNQQFTQILKNRVYCELGKGPKPVIYAQQPLSISALKVDLENIYNTQPLLMERQAVKSKNYKQSMEKAWQPII